MIPEAAFDEKLGFHVAFFDEAERRNRRKPHHLRGWHGRPSAATILWPRHPQA